MKVNTGNEWQFDNIRFVGETIAGIRSSFVIPELRIAFDAGQIYPFHSGVNVFCITHGHIDHAGGIPHIVSGKALFRQKRPIFLVPYGLIDPLNKILKTWQEIEGFSYEYELVAVKPNDTFVIDNSHFVKCFPTCHRVDSIGYTLFTR